MKKRLVSMLATLLAAFVLATAIALAYGNNFSFPAARRIATSQGYSGAHQAYDYSFTTHTAVAAAKAGTVIESRFDLADGSPWPCDASWNARGNFIILDHGAGLTTWYFHLSNTGSTPGVGTYFYRGALMALSDDTGCSDNPHLHFATKLNGTPFNPYAGTTDWVSGAPIPMGYRNQDGTTNGPYALDRTKIHDKWLALEGKPGSPLEDDWTYICYIQTFEQGRISDCGGASASYVEFTKTYLPDIRARYSVGYGWNSSIVVRNNSPSSAIVNITIYKSDGAVLDTRTHKTLGAGAIWTLNVWDVVFDTSLGYPTGIFEGSAVVAASQDVSVVVNSQTSSQSASYNGVAASGGDPAFRIGRTIYTPLSLAQYGNWHTTLVVQNTGSTNTSITIDYYNRYGTRVNTFSSSLGPNASAIYDANQHFSPGSNFSGTAIVTSTSQDIAVTVNETDGSMTGAYNGVSTGATRFWTPLILKGYGSWTTGIQIQNLDATTFADVTITYYSGNGLPAQTQTGSIYPRGFWNVVPNVPNDWTGVAKVECTNGRNLAVELDEYNSVPGDGDLQSYTGLSWASTRAYLPDIRNDGSWITGLQVQNVGSASSHVQLIVNGTVTWDDWIELNGWRNFGATRIPASGQAVVLSLNG